jgi:hypothetical protein
MNELSIKYLKKLLDIQAKVCEDLYPLMMAAQANNHEDFPGLKTAWLNAIVVRREKENELINKLEEAATDYFVRDVAANTFKVAASAGGAAINLTDNGTSPTPEKSIKLSMAKADKKDGKIATTILGILMDVHQSCYPRGVDGEMVESDPKEFNEYEYDHLRVFFDRLMTLMDQNPSALIRVIGGMVYVVMYEENQLIDPDSSVLELHPRIKKALEAYNPEEE